MAASATVTDQPTTKPGPLRNVAIHCGWGRLLFSQTFENASDLTEELKREARGTRDIAFYITDPHVVLNAAPQHLFLDPSHTYRLALEDYQPSTELPGLFTIEPARGITDFEEANRIYHSVGMVPLNLASIDEAADPDNPSLSYFVARHTDTGAILGVVNAVDHVGIFNDPSAGCSLWALAVDMQADVPRVGEALSRHVIEHFAKLGRHHLDLSVMHDNEQAIRLYEKLGFKRTPQYALKLRNPINEKLFTENTGFDDFNPYARLIIDEALRRGITVEPLDPVRGFFTLSWGGRRIVCRESLSEMTSAIAFTRCDDKQITRDVLAEAGVRVPAQQLAGSPEDNRAFLKSHGSIVVKPAQGEQGRGVHVDIDDEKGMTSAIRSAAAICDRVLLESFHRGQDLRVIVIGNEVVAAAIRKPAEVVGTGRHTVAELIARASRRRAAATGGESRIPVDAETERCVAAAGYSMDDTPKEGRAITVRRAANLHTGGTIHDVTPVLHPQLRDAAIRCAVALAIPVVGMDFIIDSPDQPDYVVIEANERPGLANHEPQPTAERFVDLLFPQTTRPVLKH